MPHKTALRIRHGPWTTQNVCTPSAFMAMLMSGPEPQEESQDGNAGVIPLKLWTADHHRMVESSCLCGLFRTIIRGTYDRIRTRPPSYVSVRWTFSKIEHQLSMCLRKGRWTQGQKEKPPVQPHLPRIQCLLPPPSLEFRELLCSPPQHSLTPLSL